MKAITVADTGDTAVQGPSAVLVRVDVLDAGNTAQVDPVELEAAEQRGGDDEGPYPGARVLVVVHVERVIPAHRLGLVVVR